jgi:uncharacterized RDD family membrane protein YckC
MAPRTARFFAKLFDAMVLMAIMLPSFLLSAPANNLDGMNLLTKISVLVFIFYLLFKDGLGGQSVGKRIMRISVINTKSRRPCSIFQSLIRNIALLSVLDVFFVMSSSQRRLGIGWLVRW